MPIAQYQAANGLPPTPFVYPAWVALPYVPLAALPYDLAGALHVALMLAALVVAAVLGARVFAIPRAWAVLGTLAWAPAAAGVVSGQNTSVALLLVVGVAAALQAGRPVLAGILGGLLLYKPQLDVPIVLTLAWRGVVASGRRGGRRGDRPVPARRARRGRRLGLAGDLVGLAADVQPARPGRERLAGRLAARPARPPHAGDAAPGSFTGPALVGYVVAALIVLRCLPALRRWSPERAIALACAAGLV